MSNIKLVAIDLDGTFLTDTKEVLAENVNVVHQLIKRGIKVVICTGRTLPGVERFVKAIGLESQSEYLILQNGAAIYQLPEYELQTAHYQKQSHCSILVDYFINNRPHGVQLVAFNEQQLFVIDEKEVSDIVQKDAETLATEPTLVSVEEFNNLSQIFKMMVLGSKEQLDIWQAQLPNEIYQIFDVVRSHPIIIEFLSKNINKATALATLCQALSIDQTEVMAIGDENNDLEMLRWAKYSVAMGNAKELVKANARYHTISNNEAGVAKIINDIILTDI